MLIYLLRHGDASQDPSLHDSERPLTQLGQQQAETVARFLQRSRTSISTILSSPLQRAREMAAPLQEHLGVRNFRITEYLIPGNDVRQVIAQINGDSVESVLLVGHEPLLGELASLLVTTADDLNVEFKKGALALIEAGSPVREAQGVLKWLITAESMDLVK
ncbi:MAG: phosphohistidine phosphatase SixA [Ignavibacteriales bacterium]|nr:phosphohistidine phosphatase SixA [Ignavibacteriales bacterium]